MSKRSKAREVFSTIDAIKTTIEEEAKKTTRTPDQVAARKLANKTLAQARKILLRKHVTPADARAAIAEALPLLDQVILLDTAAACAPYGATNV